VSTNGAGRERSDRRVVRAALCALVLLAASTASAQAPLLESIRPPVPIAPSLKIASVAFLSAASLDWSSTWVNLATGPYARENNPELAWLNGHPAAIVALGATQDVAGLWLWSRFVGRQHPRLANAGLFVAAGLRVAIAARNVSRYRRYQEAY
jgi:hypothetical protein